jgi:hypothetical protein
MTVRRVQAEQDTERPEYDSKDRAAGIGQLGRDNRGWAAMTEQSGHDICDMTTAVKMGQESPEGSVWTGRPYRSA